MLHRRDRRADRLVALVLVAAATHAEAQRLRRAHANVLELYDERGRELERLHRRLVELEAEPRVPSARAA